MIFTVSVKAIKRIKKRMHTRVRPFYGHMEASAKCVKNFGAFHIGNWLYTLR